MPRVRERRWCGVVCTPRLHPHSRSLTRPRPHLENSRHHIIPTCTSTLGIAFTSQACVATCKAEPATANCGGVVFKHNATPGGLGKACGPGHTCCYLMTKTAIGNIPPSNCRLPCYGWDSWAAVGIFNGTEPTNPGDGYVANFGKWRNPVIARTFFDSARSMGAGRNLTWQLAMRERLRSKTTDQPLKFNFTVAANGTILAMVNASDGGALVQPLRQFRRGRPFH